jgi:hypothetical protein
MSNLVIEILLRLAKIGLAALLGLLLYAVLTGPLGAPGSVELALLSFVAGGVAILLLESSVI